jgi:glycosyltransferase involved in cell wall biosynthesis
MLRSSTYDYIHAVEESAFFATWIGQKAGIPVLYDMQCSIPQHLSRHPVLGARPLQAFLRRCERWLLSRADLIVASAGLGEYVRGRVPSARVEEWLFPAAIWSGKPEDAQELRERLELPEDAQTVVYSGTFGEYQGLPALVAAARSVVRARPGTVFIAVGGDDKGAAHLEALVRSSGLTPHFRILAREPRERALAYIRLADVLVSPRAHGDNLPLKIGDYMAATKPIVATRIPAHTVVLDSTRAVLTGTDEESLARGILSVLEDGPEALRLAEAAKAYGDRHLSWSCFFEAVRGYIQLLARQPKAAA